MGEQSATCARLHLCQSHPPHHTHSHARPLLSLMARVLTLASIASICLSTLVALVLLTSTVHQIMSFIPSATSSSKLSLAQRATTLQYLTSILNLEMLEFPVFRHFLLLIVIKIFVTFGILF